MNQVVHLDMKSPNVLIWQFPSPRDKRQIRIHQSGEVLIKIADYGISQVSTGLTLRVDNSPVGTPGFMAPELFDRAGQVISSEKVRGLLLCCCCCCHHHCCCCCCHSCCYLLFWFFGSVTSSYTVTLLCYTTLCFITPCYATA